jgi:hypothetical protein
VPCALWRLASRNGYHGAIARVAGGIAGAPVSVFVAFKRSAYTVTKGEITKFNSVPGMRRGFYAKYGSTVT